MEPADRQSGRLDLNQRSPAPKAGANINHLRQIVGYRGRIKRRCRTSPASMSENVVRNGSRNGSLPEFSPLFTPEVSYERSCDSFRIRVRHKASKDSACVDCSKLHQMSHLTGCQQQFSLESALRQQRRRSARRAGEIYPPHPGPLRNLASTRCSATRRSH